MRKPIIILLFLFLTCTHFNASAQYQEGDTLHFWSVSYIDWPPLWGSPQRDVEAVCKKTGDHCYVFVETSVVPPLQADIDNLVAEFDQHFYPALTDKYGSVPNELDDDSNVFILVFDESLWAGYFDPGQQMTDSMVNVIWNRHSNQREIIYVAASSYGYGEQEIVAHEFGHLLHWGQDHSAEPANPGIYWESAFVDEGFSTFAAVYLTQNLYQHNVYCNDPFFRYNPDIPLIYFSDYNQAELFMLFMFEHYGQWSYISSLISNQVNGWQGVDSTLHQLGYSTHFEDAFEQYCVANYIDDTVYDSGKYSYSHYDFPAAINNANHFTFPTGVQNGTLVPFGCDYNVFSSSTPKPLQISFSGDPTSKFRLSFIMINPTGGTVHKVVSVIPDGSGNAIFNADSLGIAYNKLIMVAMNIDTNLDTNDYVLYSYSASLTSGLDENDRSENLMLFPNPVADHLYFYARYFSYDSIRIFDSMGNLVLVSEIIGEQNKLDVSGLKSGLYLFELMSKEKQVFHRFLKL